MVSGHEIPQNTSDDDAMTRQEEIALDQGVYNPHMEHAHHDGSWPAQNIPRPRSGRKRPVYEPRHGDSEADLGSPTYFNEYVPPTPEEVAERQAVLAGPGHRAAVVAGALASHDALTKELSGDSITYRIARERAAQEKRERRLRGE